MKVIALINPGLEELAQKEIKELTRSNTQLSKQAVEFEVKDKEEFLKLSKKMQSTRRLLISLGKTEDLDKIELVKLDWEKVFPKEFTFKVEVEGVKGQDNRIEIAKKIAGKFYEEIEGKIKPTLELKKPQLLVIVYFNQEEYFLGIDFNVEEINSRSYRVFAHHASFKGDLAYFFARESGFKPGEKLLVGFAKDGAIAIEAAKFALTSGNDSGKVFAFCEGMQNLTAARKNAKLAGSLENLEINKYSLEDLDVKYEKESFSRIVFHITTKDEVKINEIYYQASFILQKGGTLLFIGRENWDLPISEKFELVKHNKIHRGESVTSYWLLKKK